MSSRTATALFAGLLAAAVALRVYLVLALPFGQTVSGGLEGLNDEPAHFNYVRHLVEHRTFPVQTRHVAEPGAFERADFEYYQPPLYYLLCAPLVAAAGPEAGLVLCRGLSLVCALLSLIVLGRILARLGLGVSARRAGVVFAALLPVHAYFTSVVSNDALCWLFALLLTGELLARAAGAPGARGAADPRQADLRLGALLGLGMLVKSSLVIFYPVALVVYALIERRGPGRQALTGALVALGVSLLVAGPWYLRNVVLYASPFALEVGFGPPEPGRWTLPAQLGSASGTVRSFWFPMQHLEGTPAVVTLRAVGALLVALHAGLAALHLARRLPLDPPRFVALALLAAAIGGHVALNLAWGESEGRFLLTALAPIVLLFVAPVFAFTSRWRAGGGLAWTWLVLLAAHPYLFLALA